MAYVMVNILFSNIKFELWMEALPYNIDLTTYMWYNIKIIIYYWIYKIIENTIHDFLESKIVQMFAIKNVYEVIFKWDDGWRKSNMFDVFSVFDV